MGLCIKERRIRGVLVEFVTGRDHIVPMVEALWGTIEDAIASIGIARVKLHHLPLKLDLGRLTVRPSFHHRVVGVGGHKITQFHFTICMRGGGDHLDPGRLSELVDHHWGNWWRRRNDHRLDLRSGGCDRRDVVKYRRGDTDCRAHEETPIAIVLQPVIEDIGGIGRISNAEVLTAKIHRGIGELMPHGRSDRIGGNSRVSRPGTIIEDTAIADIGLGMGRNA